MSHASAGASPPGPTASGPGRQPNQRYNFNEEKYQDIPERNSTILLIGPTQHGKSTLGNFLVNGVEDDEAEPLLLRFAEGNGNVSESAECQAARAVDELKHEHVILDTPGFGDTNGKDHLLQLHLAESLMALGQEGYSIGLVVVVVKRGSVLGREYKKLITMYHDLLGDFFAKNALLVFTHSSERELDAQQKRAARQRPPGAGPRQAMEALQLETAKLLGMPRIPFLHLDATCTSASDTKDKDKATKARQDIFEAGRTANLPDADTQIDGFRRIPKTPEWMNEDSILAAHLEGEIEGCEMVLGSVDARKVTLEEEMSATVKKLAECNRLVEENESWLREHNTNTEEVLLWTERWVARGGGILDIGPLSRKETVYKPDRLPGNTCRISSVTVSGGRLFSGGSYYFERNAADSESSIRVVIKSGFFWRDKERFVSLFTTRAEKHRDEIQARKAARLTLAADLDAARKAVVSRIPDALADANSEKATVEDQKKALVTRLTTLTDRFMGRDAFRRRCEQSPDDKRALDALPALRADSVSSR